MSGIRIGEIVQPAWSRTADAVAGTTSSVALKVQQAIDRTAAVSQEVSTFVAMLLSPAALISLALGIWRIGADLGWTDQFLISNGLFSHWQVWVALAIALQAVAATFSRVSQKAQASEQN